MRDIYISVHKYHIICKHCQFLFEHFSVFSDSLQIPEAVKLSRWQTFMSSLNLETRVDFEEGDIGLAGGALLWLDFYRSWDLLRPPCCCGCSGCWWLLVFSMSIWDLSYEVWSSWVDVSWLFFPKKIPSLRERVERRKGGPIPFRLFPRGNPGRRYQDLWARACASHCEGDGMIAENDRCSFCLSNPKI